MLTDERMTSMLTLANAAMILSSLWKPVLILLPLWPWAWVVTRLYDKHAAEFHLPRRKWNAAHMLVGLGAVAAVLFVGVPIGGQAAFWVGWMIMVILLAADLVAYAVVANRDERVPAHRHIKLNMQQFAEARKKKDAAKSQAKVALTLLVQDEKGKFSVPVPPPAAETPDYELRIAGEGLYVKAAAARAAQVDIGPTGKDNLYGVSYLVDGVRQGVETMPAANAAKLMDFWRAAARMDMADRRRKQVKDVSVEQEGGIKKIARVTSIGVPGGMRLTMLFDPERAVTRKQSELGLLEPQVKELQAIVADGKGVVILAAPPDMGRTTTMYALLKMHDAYQSNVQTVEIDAQAALEGIRSNVWVPGTAGSAGDAAAGAGGGEFSTTVRSILRRDPDVVGIAELPDPQTAKEIARADQERTRTYLSVKAPDSITAIQGFVKGVGDTKQGSDCLHGVVAQKLVRRLCTNCRVAYPPSADMLKKLGVPEGKVTQLFKKGGQVLIKNRPETCPVCGGGGFLGQEGIFEVFAIGPEERALIAAGNFNGLRGALRKRQLPTIQQVAIRKAVDGVTSVEEVMRVTADRPEGGAPAPAPAAQAATA